MPTAPAELDFRPAAPAELGIISMLETGSRMPTAPAELDFSPAAPAELGMISMLETGSRPYVATSGIVSIIFLFTKNSKSFCEKFMPDVAAS
jgi:hypothetical protein